MENDFDNSIHFNFAIPESSHPYPPTWAARLGTCEILNKNRIGICRRSYACAFFNVKLW